MAALFYLQRFDRAYPCCLYAWELMVAKAITTVVCAAITAIHRQARHMCNFDRVLHISKTTILCPIQ
jgi:hypothetical protein